MDLIDIYYRIANERGEGKEFEPVQILAPDGERFEILSINWDDESGKWVIIGE